MALLLGTLRIEAVAAAGRRQRRSATRVAHSELKGTQVATCFTAMAGPQQETSVRAKPALT
jgi:hypothetical protein